MTIKTIIDEDFSNYKKPSMVIGCPRCTMKCGAELCQNNPWLKQPDITINNSEIIRRYLDNNLTKAIVFGGLDPIDTWEDLKNLVYIIRAVGIKDDIIIYTGYTKCEIVDKVEWLKKFSNIIIKFGRYVPNQKPHYDEVLGVDLASDNQYAEKIS